MNYAQKYDLFFPFFIKVVVNKSKAYSFLIIGMIHLQKILLSVIMLRFHFFIAKQGTWVNKDDRGPWYQDYNRTCWKVRVLGAFEQIDILRKFMYRQTTLVMGMSSIERKIDGRFGAHKMECNLSSNLIKICQRVVRG